ncbi:MAG: hypothetical protein HC767_10500 [Akkermansiaceae bacterium]|nr:hypothetical protein [Akkermansiaceae bacterium]
MHAKNERSSCSPDSVAGAERWVVVRVDWAISAPIKEAIETLSLKDAEAIKAHFI